MSADSGSTPNLEVVATTGEPQGRQLLYGNEEGLLSAGTGEVSDSAPATPQETTLNFVQRRTSQSSRVSSLQSLNSRFSSWTKVSQQAHPVVDELKSLQQKILADVGGPGGKPWINTTSGNMVFGVLILLNAAFIGVDVELSGGDGTPPAYMTAIESCFLVAFWVEIALRMRANGLSDFCYDKWGPFDFTCTLLGSLDAWLLTPLAGGSSALSGISVLRTLRLLRLMRLLRVFRTFSGLAKLVTILVNSMQAMLWLAILSVIFIYISSVFVFTLLRDRREDDADIAALTPSILFTMFHHLMLLTGEGYTDTWVNPTWQISGWWRFYWVACVIWLHIFMLNLMVGVLVQRSLGSKKQEEEALAHLAVESTQFRSTLMTLFETNDFNADGILSVKELNALLDGRDLEQILKTFKINTDVPRSLLLQVFDLVGNDEISFREFYETCVRLCGSSKDVRSFMLQVDVSRLKQDMLRRVSKIRGAIPEAAAGPSVPASRRPSRGRSGRGLRALLRQARERMEVLERRQDDVLATLAAVRGESLPGRGDGGLAEGPAAAAAHFGPS